MIFSSTFNILTIIQNQCCQMILADTRHEILKNRHFTRKIFNKIARNCQKPPGFQQNPPNLTPYFHVLLHFYVTIFQKLMIIDDNFQKCLKKFYKSSRVDELKLLQRYFGFKQIFLQLSLEDRITVQNITNKNFRGLLCTESKVVQNVEK